jgi:hypothetical protein
MSKYKFKIPIGDWSADGHGKHDDYLIESNFPVEKIRELYFQACDKIGFSLDGSYKETELTPMSDYGDYSFKKETLDALLKFGVQIEKDLVDSLYESYSEEDGDASIDIETLLDIVLAFIKTQDENLTLRVLPENDLPMFQFYGFDKKGRHIGYFGYGLFD